MTLEELTKINQADFILDVIKTPTESQENENLRQRLQQSFIELVKEK